MSCTAVNEDGNPCSCSHYKKRSKKTTYKTCRHSKERHINGHSAAHHAHGESISDVVNKNVTQLMGSTSNFGPFRIPQSPAGALPNGGGGSSGISHGMQPAGYGLHGTQLPVSLSVCLHIIATHVRLQGGLYPKVSDTDARNGMLGGYRPQVPVQTQGDRSKQKQGGSTSTQKKDVSRAPSCVKLAHLHTSL